MPLGAPIDPRCGANVRGVRIAGDEADLNLKALDDYAQRYGIQVWKFKDGKIGLTSRLYDGRLGSRNAPLVFGAEGESTAESVAHAFNAIYAMSNWLKEEAQGAEGIERQVSNSRLDHVPLAGDSASNAPFPHAASAGQTANEVRVQSTSGVQKTLKEPAQMNSTQRQILWWTLLVGGPLTGLAWWWQSDFNPYLYFRPLVWTIATVCAALYIRAGGTSTKNG